MLFLYLLIPLGCTNAHDLCDQSVINMNLNVNYHCDAITQSFSSVYTHDIIKTNSIKKKKKFGWLSQSFSSSKILF